MSLDVSVLLEAVAPQEGTPDPRDSDLFTFLNQEIDKLSSLSASSQPDWARIEQSGCEFLSTQSKDFLVASWLAEAWTQRHAMLGMVAGFSLMAGLIEMSAPESRTSPVATSNRRGMPSRNLLITGATSRPSTEA